MNLVAKAKLLMLNMGAAPVMWLMIALSILSMAIVLERLWFFRSVDDDVESLAKALSDRLQSGDLDGAHGVLRASPSTEAAVVFAGLVEWPHGIVAVRERMAGKAALVKLSLERRLVVLGTVGNNAPFVGLLGTVIGIIMAFEKLGEAGKNAAANGPAEVMSNIAEALVATAIGLAVAIPAVVAYNLFQRKIKGMMARTDSLSRVLIAHLESTSSVVR